MGVTATTVAQFLTQHGFKLLHPAKFRQKNTMKEKTIKQSNKIETLQLVGFHLSTDSFGNSISCGQLPAPQTEPDY